jgi:hypothetical protein
MRGPRVPGVLTRPTCRACSVDNRDERFTAGINALIDGLERAQRLPPPN